MGPLFQRGGEDKQKMMRVQHRQGWRLRGAQGCPCSKCAEDKCLDRCVAERRTPSGARNWALVWQELLEMNCPRRHMCWQSKRFYWEGAPRWRAGGWGNPGELFCLLAAVSGFTVMGVVSGLSLANHSGSESFLVGHALFSQDGCQREGFREVVGHVVSPFDLSWTLPVGGGSSVPCSLPGPPVIRQLMQMVTMVAGQGGDFSQCASPNRHTGRTARRLLGRSPACRCVVEPQGGEGTGVERWGPGAERWVAGLAIPWRPCKEFDVSSECHSSEVSTELSGLGQAETSHFRDMDRRVKCFAHTDKEQRAGSVPWPGEFSVIHFCTWFPWDCSRSGPRWPGDSGALPCPPLPILEAFTGDESPSDHQVLLP